MAIGFNLHDVMHRIYVKFVHSFLPDAKKPYYLKAVYQQELDIHGIASKAAVYNLHTSPKVIEEGLTTGLQLMHYLAADGYRINTPLFKLRIRIPGEYDGHETSLGKGVYPVARLQATAEFRKYLKEHIKLEFGGIDRSEGFIAKAMDEATGRVNEVLTSGNILTIQGNGLKIESDSQNKLKAGVYFKPKTGAAIKASIIPVNKPRTLKVFVPNELVPGTAYTLAVETMSSTKGNGMILKKMRTIQSDFTLVA